jgi:hypothetical protein
VLEILNLFRGECEYVSVECELSEKLEGECNRGGNEEGEERKRYNYLYSVELMNLNVGGVLITSVHIMNQDLRKKYYLLIWMFEITVDRQVTKANRSLAIPLFTPLMS